MIAVWGWKTLNNAKICGFCDFTWLGEKNPLILSELDNKSFLLNLDSPWFLSQTWLWKSNNASLMKRSSWAMPELGISDLVFSVKIQHRLKIILFWSQKTLSETPFRAASAAEVLGCRFWMLWWPKLVAKGDLLDGDLILRSPSNQHRSKQDEASQGKPRSFNEAEMFMEWAWLP